MNSFRKVLENFEIFGLSKLFPRFEEFYFTEAKRIFSNCFLKLFAVPDFGPKFSPKF